MKKALSLILALILTLSVGTAAYAAPVRASDESAAAQLNLLFQQFGSFKQDDSAGSWSYAITDLNHNGRLELFATVIQGEGRFTQVKVWELGEDHSTVAPCTVVIPEDESFPDILTDNADTWYDPNTDVWYYTFYDNIVLSPTETYYAKCAINLSSGVLSFQQLALQHTTITGGVASTEYMDNNGNIISGEQYNNINVNSNLTELVRSSTNFDWFSAAEATEARFADSYAVNKGVRQPTSKAQQAVAPAPASTPAPTSFLTITKNPINESHPAGETAWFVADASGWTGLAWTFVSPYGAEYSAQSMRSSFPSAAISGESGTTLTIGKVNEAMSGWGVYCTFYNNAQTARTNTAYLYVSSPSQTSAPQTYVQDTVTCPNCGTRNVSIYGKCWNCGYDVYSYVNGRDGSVSHPSYYSYYYDPDVIFLDDGSIGVAEPGGDFTVYNGDGSYVTYGWDGSVYADMGDGTSFYQGSNGNTILFDDNGNYIEVDDNGNYEYYDSWSGSFTGGNYYTGNSYQYSEDDLLEAYSYLYGWGSLGYGQLDW